MALVALSAGSGLQAWSPRTLLLVTCAVLILHQSQQVQSSEIGAYAKGGCTDQSPCQHACIDLEEGGFQCTCKDGYQLNDNGYSCLEIIPNPATTIPPELHDLDAAEADSGGEDDPENDSGSDEGFDDDEFAESLARLVPGQSAAEADPDDNDSYQRAMFESPEQPQGGGRDYGYRDPDYDAEIQELENLSKRTGSKAPRYPDDNANVDADADGASRSRSRGGDRSRNKNRDRSRDRERGREVEREGGRRKGGKGKGGKGKNRGNKGRNKGSAVPGIQGDGTWENKPSGYPDSLGQVVLKSEDKSAAENEVEVPDPMVKHRNCAELHCQAGGLCVPDTMRGGVRCRCPLGTDGDYCERDIIVKYPKFLGTGYVAFAVLRGAYREFSVSLEFKPDTHNGLLMFSGDVPKPKSDFFSIALVDGKVELRFDCGTGMGQVTTKNAIKLGDWNRLVVTRHDWYGEIKLNDGPEVRGRSKGLFSRITFREDLYLGGYKNTSAIGAKTGMQWGFVGCVRRVEVNNKVYDMRKGAFVGDAIHGMDVGECSAHVCDNVKCLNGGTCTTEAADTSVCLCPLGTAGDRCEGRIDIHVPHMEGNSYLQFLGLRQMVLSFTEVEIVLKPTDPNGLILYSGFSTDRTGDFISLALRDGYVDFRFDLGTGPAIIESREPLTMNAWHVVRFSRTGRDGYLQVDKEAAVHGIAKGAYTQLTVNLDLFIGGHRNFDETAKKAELTTAFKGCIQEVILNKTPLKLVDEAINGVNVDNCEHPCATQPCLNGGHCKPIHDSFVCQCPLGFENTKCEDRIVRYRYRYRYRRDVNEQPLTVPMFSGDGYLVYSDPFMMQRIHGTKVEIQMRIRPTAPDGLLLWTSEPEMGPHSDYLALGLRDGHAQFSFNLGSGEVVIAYNYSRLDDGKWHTIRAHRYEKTGYLEIDGTEVVEGTSPGNLRQLNTYGKLYIGGMENVEQQTLGKYQSGFSGCITNVTLATDFSIDLMDAAKDVENVQQCPDERDHLLQGPDVVDSRSSET